MWQRLADELGWRTSTTATATASVGDTTRVVLADEVRDDEAGQGLVSGQWLYVRSGVLAPTQRRILRHNAGHLGPMGAVTLSRPLSSALINGSAIDITSPLPVVRH